MPPRSRVNRRGAARVVATGRSKSLCRKSLLTSSNNHYPGCNGATVWRDVGYAYRSGTGDDERISVKIGAYMCVLVKRARDIEEKYHQLNRRRANRTT